MVTPEFCFDNGLLMRDIETTWIHLSCGTVMYESPITQSQRDALADIALHIVATLREEHIRSRMARTSSLARWLGLTVCRTDARRTLA
jgi:hypothetical protein